MGCVSNMDLHCIKNKVLKFPIKDFFSKYEQIQSKLRIWTHLLKKFLIKIFIFCAVFVLEFSCYWSQIVLNKSRELFILN